MPAFYVPPLTEPKYTGAADNRITDYVDDFRLLLTEAAIESAVQQRRHPADVSVTKRSPQ